jgi:hypothetical protein
MDGVEVFSLSKRKYISMSRKTGSLTRLSPNRNAQKGGSPAIKTYQIK